MFIEILCTYFNKYRNFLFLIEDLKLSPQSFMKLWSPVNLWMPVDFPIQVENEADYFYLTQSSGLFVISLKNTGKLLLKKYGKKWKH